MSRNKKKSTFTSTAALMALLPVMFLAGLFVGYQVWATPTIEVSAAADTAAQKFDIPIYEDDAVLGSADTPVTIIEFSDYQCPYCRQYHNETFDRILAEYGDVVQYVYKDLPLEQLHPEAVPAANAAHCAGEQDSFWEYHDLLFSNQQGFGFDAYIAYANSLELDMPAFVECLEENRYLDTIDRDIQILVNLNAPLSTPTFFINGQYLAGAQPFSEFARLIEAELGN
ncbi:MAG: DsbA family protein [Anaerolineales bacterium]|nr:DsbA family protein [Anaerolineales bacterium]